MTSIKEKEDESKAKHIIEPISKALLEILKEQITNAKSVGGEIKRIAHAIDRKPETIKALIYANKGSLTLKMATLIKAFHLEDEQIQSFFEDLENYLKKITPLKESDKGWMELGSILSENEKSCWIESIKKWKEVDQQSKKGSYRETI